MVYSILILAVPTFTFKWVRNTTYLTVLLFILSNVYLLNEHKLRLLNPTFLFSNVGFL